MSKWTCNWEIVEYWDKVMASPELTALYHKEFKDDIANFNIKVSCPAVDVGAGAFGGVFNYVSFIGEKIVVDPCATEYQKRYGKTPEGVKLIDGYCNNIPLSDFSMKTVFCIETLDHCNSQEEYLQSGKELVRILSKTGTLYFMLPLRKKPTEGHFISLETMPMEKIFEPFRSLNISHKIVFEHLYIEGVRNK